MPNKRKLFIGCSKEALDVARQVKTIIENSNLPNIDVDVWDTTPWLNLKSALDSLNKNIDEYYYSIFIGYPDDILVERGTTFHSTRDNTIFEFGLFFSRLGSERTFFLRPKNITGQPKFKIHSDIGTSAFVHIYELDFTPTTQWTFKSFNSTQLIRFLQTEESRLQTVQTSPKNKLKQQTKLMESELNEANKNDEYYINRLKSGLDQLLFAKQHATGIGIQELTIDTLNAVKDVKDFCKPLQLAAKQSYTHGIKFVWVFSSKPFEFLNSTEEYIKKIKEAVVLNLKNGVLYTYFVSHSEFKLSDIDNLIPDKKSALRNKIEVIFVESKYFKTFFTLHFKDNHQLESVYMSSLLPHRNDLMIQVSDPDHIKRIKERIQKLKGEHSKSGKVNIVDYTVD